jgi:acyl-CoA dehydrogenase
MKLGQRGIEVRWIVGSASTIAALGTEVIALASAIASSSRGVPEPSSLAMAETLYRRSAGRTLRPKGHPVRFRPTVNPTDLATKAGAGGATARRPIPPFTAEHEEFRATVRRFVQTELRPHAREWEEAQWFPNQVFARLAELGYIGLKFAPEYGGDGDPVADAVFVEELAWCGSGGAAAGIGAHSGIALPPIEKFGSDEQKERYLVPGIQGEKIAALAITEPDAGSDVASIRTHARRVDGGYVVTGSKTFITGGVRADVLVTAVKTKPQGGHHGLSFLLIDRGPGVESSALQKLGWHASDTAHISFDDVFVPEENLLGQENAGFYLIMANFQWERLLMSLGAVGAMGVAFENTLRYAQERRAFGKPIGKHQAIRHKLAEIALKIEAGRDVTYSALRRYVAGEDAVRDVTIAKLATQRAAFEVMDACLQIHGGAGYMVEYDIERAARDARLGPIGGGTDEIMKEILGRSLGL